MTLKQYQKKVKKLHKLERQLIKLITATDNKTLIDKFFQWQAQRRKCNEGFIEFIKEVNI